MSRHRRSLFIVLTAAVVMLLALLAPTGPVAADPPAVSQKAALDLTAKPQLNAGTYVVQLAGAPLGSYRGEVPGLPKTAPAKGKKLDPTTTAAKAYRKHLATQRTRVLSAVPDVRPIYNYDVAFNGFAADLTAAQANALATKPGVVRLWKNETYKADTVSTPKFLGLAGSAGVWQSQYAGAKHAGEGVIIGDIDTGITPESPSFAALPTPRPDQVIIDDKWHGDDAPGGSCWHGKGAGKINCNNKIIGARYFTEGMEGAIKQEYESPRDFGGHGTHTASTAAGDYGVPAVINGVRAGRVSGMAPAARLAVYKALWAGEDGTSSGTTTDLIAAIDRATADGVDVINYSISGSSEYIVDPIELAHLNASYAGVFVSASAGNDGPTASTVAHNSPWLTTVAASTHDRIFTKTVTLGSGDTYDGVGVGPAVGPARVVSSAQAGMPSASDEDALLCAPGALSPAKVRGKIVFCARGIYDRVDKSAEVKSVGGVGMVLYNTEPNTLDADFHAVPSIHVDDTVGPKLVAYAEAGGGTATISAGVRGTKEAPVMADFSSTGPALAGGGDLLKPDITAPGVDIIAAVAPPGNDGENFASYQGTSMSTPHVSGIAALVKGKHQDWSPMAIKSALMTTASQTDNRGNPIADYTGAEATPFNYGAGHVTPSRAFDPGLVYESGVTDWAAYACAIGQAQLVTEFGDCEDWPEIDPSDLNYPSVSIGALAGAQTVTRTVTNVTGRSAVFTASIEAPDGMNVTVSPQRLIMAPGATATYELSISRTTAELDTYGFGAITFTDAQGASARSPIVVRPVALSVPDEVSGTGTSGSHPIDVGVGYDGALNASVAGLAAAKVTPLDLQNTGAQFDPAAPAESDRTGAVELSVPNGGAARVATYDADYQAGVDVDIYVFLKGAGGTLTWVGVSSGSTATELVTLTQPGDYVAYVSLFGAPTDAVTVQANTWSAAPDGGNLTATPASQQVMTGEPAQVTLAWSGLTVGKRYLGLVTFADGDGAALGRTVVTVDG